MEDSKVRVLLEDISHQYKTLKEGIDSLLPLNDRVKKLEEDVSEIKEDVKIIKLSLPNKANVADLELVKKDVNLLKRKVGLKGV